MTEGQILFMTGHYRAAADMVMKWALSESKHCNIELAEWFPSADEKQRLLDLLDTGKSKLQQIGKLEKVVLWLRPQYRQWSNRNAARTGRAQRGQWICAKNLNRGLSRF